MSTSDAARQQRLAKLARRVEEMHERLTMTFLDVRQLEGKVSRMDTRLDRLESMADRQGHTLDDLSRRVDMIIRHFGIGER